MNTTCETGFSRFCEVVLLGCPCLFQFCPVLAGWVRGLVAGRPWAYASPFPSHSDLIIYCSYYLIGGYLPKLS